METRFGVNYETSRRNMLGAWRMANPFAFCRRGSLAFDGDAIVFRGRRRKLFSWRDEEIQSVPLAAVCNVTAMGRTVLFDLGLADGLLHEVRLSLASEAEALELAQRLPRSQTEAFVIERAEWDDFRDRMFAFQPGMPATQALLVLNIIVFVLMLFSGAGLFSVKGAVAVDWGSNFGPLTLSGQWWRLFTSLFIHFGLVHIGLNMLTLRVIGSLVERLFGSVRFVALYLLGGMAGSVVSVWWHPQLNSAGASGAIFAIFGAVVAFLLKDGNAMPATVGRKMLKDMAGILAINLAFGLMAGIDNAAHIGGLVAGFVLGALLARPLPYLSR